MRNDDTYVTPPERRRVCVCVRFHGDRLHADAHTHTPHQPVSIVGEFNLKERRAVNEGRGEELINAARWV